MTTPRLATAAHQGVGHGVGDDIGSLGAARPVEVAAPSEAGKWLRTLPMSYAAGLELMAPSCRARGQEVKV